MPPLDIESSAGFFTRSQRIIERTEPEHLKGNNVILAAGGTGGHLFPAFALAEELLRRGYVIALMTDMRGGKFDSDFPARTVYRVPSATLSSRSLPGLSRTAMDLLRGVIAAHRIMARTSPKAVFGFGGYPTFPPLVAAWFCRVPFAIHEQNAVMGRANRMLAPMAKFIATSFEPTAYIKPAHGHKVRLTGNPVRKLVAGYSDVPYQPPDGVGPLKLLIFGGSQGARYFSDTVPEALRRLDESLRGRLRVVQQCREEDLERVRASYEKAGINAELAAFFGDLPARIANAHLIIARAGASTVAELAALARPSILVPLPHSLDNDQLQNATRLQESGGAWCIAQAELTPERLAAELGRLFHEPVSLKKAAAGAKAAGRLDAANRLADLTEELVSSHQAGAGKEDTKK